MKKKIIITIIITLLFIITKNLIYRTDTYYIADYIPDLSMKIGNTITSDNSDSSDGFASLAHKNCIANHIKILYNIFDFYFEYNHIKNYLRRTILMATNVHFEDAYDGVLWFSFDDGKTFAVSSFNDGIIVIKDYAYSIESLIKNISECFQASSNWSGLKAIQFEYSGVSVTVTPEDSTPEQICLLVKEQVNQSVAKK